ncbi:MAG TPA: RDD family protein [Dongiaceae bacterium]|nr:RDD family protein [Dongiaceae bacterium]
MNNPYNAPGTELNQPMRDVEYLGFWARVAASIIDNIWMFVVFFILGLIVVLASGMDESVLDSVVGTVFQLVLPAFIIVGLWVKYAATPGKMVFRAKILDADTFEPVPTGRLILRYIGYFVCVLTLGIGFIWVGIDARKQGLHDKIARTVVVREKQ